MLCFVQPSPKNEYLSIKRRLYSPCSKREKTRLKQKTQWPCAIILFFFLSSSLSASLALAAAKLSVLSNIIDADFFHLNYHSIQLIFNGLIDTQLKVTFSLGCRQTQCVNRKGHGMRLYTAMWKKKQYCVDQWRSLYKRNSNFFIFLIYSGNR